jgi:hypothetical protein
MSNQHAECLRQQAGEWESALDTVEAAILGVTMRNAADEIDRLVLRLEKIASEVRDWRSEIKGSNEAMIAVDLAFRETHPHDVWGDGRCAINCDSPEVRCALPVGHSGPHSAVDMLGRCEHCGGIMDAHISTCPSVVERQSQNPPDVLCVKCGKSMQLHREGFYPGCV